jgi:hypothetical protein
VFSDYFTKYIEAVAIKEPTALIAADAIYRTIICRHGAPAVLLTDLGTNFNNELVNELIKTVNIKHANTSAYHPETDGLVERMNRTLKQMLAMHVNRRQDDWDRYLPMLTFAYNTSRHETTGETPHFLNYNREAVFPIDVALGLVPTQHIRNEDGYEYLSELQQLYQQVRERVRLSQNRQKLNYDKHHKPAGFAVDDHVMLRNDITTVGQSKKFRIKWTGPYKIAEIRLPLVTLKHLSGRKAHMGRVNVARLKQAIMPVELDRLPGEPIAIRPSNALETDVPREVEDLVEKKIVKGREYYLVKWKSRDAQFNSWESREMLPPTQVEQAETRWRLTRLDLATLQPSTTASTTPQPGAIIPLPLHLATTSSASPISIEVDTSPNQSLELEEEEEIIEEVLDQGVVPDFTQRIDLTTAFPSTDLSSTRAQTAIEDRLKILGYNPEQ